MLKHVEQLKKKGVYLSVSKGKLICKAEKGAMSSDILSEIKTKKADFVRTLLPASPEWVSGIQAGAANDIVLSENQKRMWLVSQLEQKQSQYNMLGGIEIVGELDISRFESAVKDVIKGSRVLRTKYIEKDGQVNGLLSDDCNFVLSHKDLSFLNKEDKVWRLSQISEQMGQREYDMSKDLPIDALVIEMGESVYHVMVCVHHIVSDGWSTGILLNQIVEAYNCRSEGTTYSAPTVPDYYDIQVWMDTWLKSDVLNSHIEFWQEKLAYAPLSHSLPLKKTRGEEILPERQRSIIDRQYHSAIVNIARENKITPLNVYYSLFSLALMRLTDVDDIVIGMPSAGRLHPDMLAAMGYFASTLPIRTSIDRNKKTSLKTFIALQAKNIKESFQHESLPFNKIVECTLSERDANLPPLFQIMFSTEEKQDRALLPELKGAQLTPIELDQKSVLFDIELEVKDKGHSLEYVWIYNKSIVDDRVVQAVDKNWLALLSNVTSLLEQDVKDIDLSALPDDIKVVDIVQETSDDEFNGSKLLRSVTRSPIGVVETTIAAIFADLLQKPVSSLMASDSFFDLGGQSLMAARLKSRMVDELQVEVDYGDIFNAPSIEGIAKRMVSKPFARLDREDREVVARALGVEGSVSSGISELIEDPANHAHLIDVVKRYNKNEAGCQDDAVTIPQAPEDEHYPVTASQLQHIIAHELTGDSSGSIISQAVVLKEPLHPDRFRNALSCVRMRHESLRTRIVNMDGEYRQKIEDSGDVTFTYQNMSAFDVDSNDIRRVVEAFSAQEMLLNGDLVRVLLINAANDKQLLYIGMHHAISDGVSIDIFVDEVLKAYQVGGDLALFDAEMPALSYQYKDIACWQESMDISTHPHGPYWEQVLTSAVEPLSLPIDKKRGPHRTFSGGLVNYSLNKEAVSSVGALARHCKTSEFVVLLGAINALLYKFTGQLTIPVGMPSSGRDYLAAEQQIGCYVNMLPIINTLHNNASFKGLVGALKQHVGNAKQNELYPYSAMVREFSHNSDKNRNPLFDVIVTFDESEKGLDREYASAYYLTGSDCVKADQDLTFAFYGNGHDLSLNLIYNKDLYTQTRANDIVTFLEALLVELAGNIDKPIIDLDTSVKNSYVKNKQPTRKQVTVADKLLSLDESELNNTAIICGGEHLTYRELKSHSLLLSQYLQEEYGLSDSLRVVVDVDNYADRVIAYYGVWLAGGAVIPVDANASQERKHVIARESRAEVVISDNDDTDLYLPVIHPRCGYNVTGSYVRQAVPLDSVAYILFTSGSTGKPKGVQVTHGNLCAYIDDASVAYGQGGLRVLQFVNPAFDVAFHELSRSVFTGGTLISSGNNLKMSPEALWDFVIKNRIESIIMTASLFSANIQAIEATQVGELNNTLKEIVFGGEPIQPEAVEYWFSLMGKHIQIHNAYGPTETTIISLSQCLNDIEIDSEVPMGYPLASESAYVVSSEGQILACGAKGYLVIEGSGVSKGYLDVRQNKPFSSEGAYNTGDIVKVGSSGEFIYCGRDDNQIKIRGVRLEKGEIESSLLSYRGIMDARVSLLGQKLVAWVVTSEGEVDRQALTEHVSKALSPQAVPHSFVEISQWPMTSTGKIDIQALVDDAQSNAVIVNDYNPPTTDEQKEMVKIWTSVLKADNIGISDNFFEIDGDSLAAINIVAMAKARGMSITTKDIFEKQTIEAILHHKEASACIESLREKQEKAFENDSGDDEEFIL